MTGRMNELAEILEKEILGDMGCSVLSYNEIKTELFCCFEERINKDNVLIDRRECF